MRINFILPGIILSGGVRVVFEHANGLALKGHDVRIIYPLIPLSLGEDWSFRLFAKKILGLFKNLKASIQPDWFDLKAKITRVPWLAEKFIPDADATVATIWETANYVNSYGESKGKKFYLIQHYETWCGPEEKVDRTYKLNLRKIAVSTWLKNLLEKKFNITVGNVVLNGINLDHFYPDREKQNKNIRILLPYRIEEWKGFKGGLAAFEIIKKECPDVKLVVFGPEAKKGDVPDYAEIHISPVKDRLRKVYSSCDIFLFPSLHEGSGLPPMEAMASGCAVVCADVGAVADYAINNETAMISPPGDFQALARNAIELVKNPFKLDSIKAAGMKHIKNFSWSTSTGQLEEILKNAI